MSIAKRLSRAELESIYSAANSAVWHSHYLANTHAKRTAREEDYVATLVTNGVALLAERWISLLSPKGIDLRISGVFCHGHPQVVFGTPRRQVELADLLVVHQHASKARTTSRAILIQAKMSSDATHRLPAGDAQLDLFSTWPKFEFVTGGLAPGVRDLKEVGKGSRYALVLDEEAYPEYIIWADQCPWAVCAADQILSAERSLAKLLGDMLVGKDGRTAQLAAPKDDWSRTIKDLLEVTGKRTYKRRNIGLHETPRLTSVSSMHAGLMFFAESPNFTGNVRNSSKRAVSDLFFSKIPLVQTDQFDDEPPGPGSQSAPEGGMSALIIETRDAVQ